MFLFSEISKFLKIPASPMEILIDIQKFSGYDLDGECVVNHTSKFPVSFNYSRIFQNKKTAANP